MRGRIVALAGVALLGIPAFTSGGVDLTDTKWELSGPERLIVRRLGRDRNQTDVVAEFGSDGAVDLDQDGEDLAGTYTTRGKGPARLKISLDDDSVDLVEDRLADWIEDKASARGRTVAVTVTVSGVRISGDINRAGTRATVFLRSRFTLKDGSGKQSRGSYAARLRGKRVRTTATR